jgi:DNA-binding winged helix-turn-helix (wHTH) protein
VFTRQQLLQAVWSSAPEWQDAATVTEHMRRLRNKLESAGLPSWFQTVRGTGYKFERSSPARLERRRTPRSTASSTYRVRRGHVAEHRATVERTS